MTTEPPISRVSSYFGLAQRQPHLDFVDVDVVADTKLFIDPRAIRLLPSQWGSECAGLVEDFFDRVLASIRAGDDELAKKLLRGLKEPNETHLGLSEKIARGRAVGNVKATDIWESFSQSEAVHNGLIENISDSILMVPQVGPDTISDITTNVIREALIRYTKDACNVYGIPLQQGVTSGRLWDPNNQEWYEEFVELPVVENMNGGIAPLLLVPKVIVRRRPDYDAGEYFNFYILEALRNEELDANSALVQLLKNGKRRVTKKDLMEKYGTGKSVIVEQTLRHPEALRRYHSDKALISPPLRHEELSQGDICDIPNFDTLLNNLDSTQPGRDDSKEYELAVENLLSALFHPALTMPDRQVRIHDGRKIVDIAYNNVAQSGFFQSVALHAPSFRIMVECKNYSKDPANPELDQLSGRFSPQRSRVGLLICRQIENKDLFVQRCRDTARDGRGFVLPLDHDDLRQIASDRTIDDPTKFTYLTGLFNRITN